MGNYTALVMAVELKKGTPQDVIDVLKALCGELPLEDLNLRGIILDDQPFFKCERWLMVLRGDSYYIAGNTASGIVYDDIPDCYTLTVRSNLKNYDSEIEMFLEWLAPYSDTGGDYVEFVGYKIGDSTTDEPVIIYFDRGKVKYYYVHSGLFD